MKLDANGAQPYPYCLRAGLQVLHAAFTEPFREEVESVFSEMQGAENAYTLEAMTPSTDRLEPDT
jgi:hypothetical protein